MYRLLAASVALFLAGTWDIRAAEVDEALAAIKAVQREGVGNEAAAARWKEIVKAGPPALPAILAAFKGADATAANWLRTAVEAIEEHQAMGGKKLDIARLESFVKNTENDPRARLLAFELAERADAEVRRRLLPGLLHDRGAGLRREAVDHAMKIAEVAGTDSDDARRSAFEKLFVIAREVDQVESLAKKLKDLGAKEPDVVAHLGLITRWEVAGPFSNAGLKGFTQKSEKAEKWVEFATAHPRAVVDVYTALDKPKGVQNGKKDAVYALCRTVIDSPAERAVEIRAATPNAVRVFHNGQEVFAREEYHHGNRLDQHIARVTLVKGRNEILLKVFQDDRTYDWTLDWSFQCRVCDEIGGAVPFTVLTAPKAVPTMPRPLPKKENPK